MFILLEHNFVVSLFQTPSVVHNSSSLVEDAYPFAQENEQESPDLRKQSGDKTAFSNDEGHNITKINIE